LEKRALLGNLASDYLTIAPFGPAVSPAAVELVNAKKKEFISGKLNVFQGPIKDNKGVERVKAGEAFPSQPLGKWTGSLKRHRSGEVRCRPLPSVLILTKRGAFSLPCKADRLEGQGSACSTRFLRESACRPFYNGLLGRRRRRDFVAVTGRAEHAQALHSGFVRPRSTCVGQNFFADGPFLRFRKE